MKKALIFVLAVAMAAILSGCATQEKDDGNHSEQASTDAIELGEFPLVGVSNLNNPIFHFDPSNGKECLVSYKCNIPNGENQRVERVAIEGSEDVLLSLEDGESEGETISLLGEEFDRKLTFSKSEVAHSFSVYVRVRGELGFGSSSYQDEEVSKKAIEELSGAKLILSTNDGDITYCLIGHN